ncbi:MAG: hypothetical protein K5985_01935 [Lachnospiraceae bacterium]|nr:hypothetical protein [Lachnospiraceae bacterium]
MTAENVIQLQEAVNAAIEELNEKLILDEAEDTDVEENRAHYRISSGFWEKLISC